MKLVHADYIEITSLLEEGSNSLEYEKDGETLVLDYDYHEDGYVEDDYYRGTGAFVCTDKELYIKDAASYDEEGNITQNDFCGTILRRLVA